ncbi:MAG: serine/threonine-protein kinase [Thermoanaerobaculia bacterium]|nr:serine/threonine-protein kinase [Thermoanaerobaculia bacterium]
MSQTTPAILGRYKILDEIGRGAMGVVYLAKDPLIGRLVAIKTFRVHFSVGDKELEQFRARFFREAQSAGILSHPRLVTIHDVVEDDGSGGSFIAMEYVRGTNLKQILQEEKRLELETIAEIVGQIADGLDYAHSHGVVHRDVKPANILIDANREVKITDFGIARIEAATNLTHDGQLIGTPNYMAPEQIKGDATDHRADIFSLGVVLYEMLAGDKPFKGENLTAVTHKIVYEPFTPLEQHVKGLPEGLQRVLLKALAKDPAARYGRAGDLAADVRRVVSQLKGQERLNETQVVPPFTPAASVPAPQVPAPPPAEPVSAAASAPTTVLPAVPAAPPVAPPPAAASAPTTVLPVMPAAPPAAPPPTPAATPANAPTTVLPAVPASPVAANAPTTVLPVAVAPAPPAASAPTVVLPASPAPSPPTAAPRAKSSPLRWLALVAVALVVGFGIFGPLWYYGTTEADYPIPAVTAEHRQRVLVLPLLRRAAHEYAAGQPLAALATLQGARHLAPGVAVIGQRIQKLEADARSLGQNQAVEREAAILAELETARQAGRDRRWRDSRDAASRVLMVDPTHAEAKELVRRASAELARLGRPSTPGTEGPAEVAPAPAAEPEPEVPVVPAEPVATDSSLEIEFTTEISAGTLTLYFNNNRLSQEPFDFKAKRNESVLGRVTNRFKVSPGSAEVKVWVARPGKPSSNTIVLSGNFLAGGARRLVARLDANMNLTARLE